MSRLPPATLLPPVHRRRSAASALSDLTAPRSTLPRPRSWVDRTVPTPAANVTYTHWGAKEPNLETPGQQCGGGNWSMSWGKAWGWQGAPCSKKAIYMCMKSGASRWPTCGPW